MIFAATMEIILHTHVTVQSNMNPLILKLIKKKDLILEFLREESYSYLNKISADYHLFVCIFSKDGKMQIMQAKNRNKKGIEKYL